MMNYKKLLILALYMTAFLTSMAQITQRESPKGWDKLVMGARFIDRFEAMPDGKLSKDVWGAACVVPRFTDNGIESPNISFWGGNILPAADGKYHLFVCGWAESSPKGHMFWPQSTVYHTVSDRLSGPYSIKDTIGKGHNPEAFRLKDGRYVVYVIDGRYVANNINGGWEYGKFDFNARDRRIIEGLSNLSFAPREDGSFVMVCRGGGIWISKDGLSQYNQITDKRVYPPVEGEFEDPVLWRDHIQYHMIVNDWLGRIAFYLRSKDGVKWVVDPGEAYAPGIAVHKDGRVEDWFKYERIKVFQDKYGRAIQANFAVIDTLKFEDLANDNHSSKNITIPLNPGVLLNILNKEPISELTKNIRLRIAAEEGFNPQTDIELSSLRFGSSEQVNYGGGCTMVKSENSGSDLILTFEGKQSGITEDEFAPKLIGKYKDGRMLYGYARMPGVKYNEAILSARAPSFSTTANTQNGTIEVQNFGQVASESASIKVEYIKDGNKKVYATGAVPKLEPYQKSTVQLSCSDSIENSKKYDMKITIYRKNKILSTCDLKNSDK